MKIFFREKKNPGEEHAKKEEAGTSTCVLWNSMGILKLKPFCLDFFLTYLEVKKVKESVEWRQAVLRPDESDRRLGCKQAEDKSAGGKNRPCWCCEQMWHPKYFIHNIPETWCDYFYTTFCDSYLELPYHDMAASAVAMVTAVRVYVCVQMNTMIYQWDLTMVFVSLLNQSFMLNISIERCTDRNFLLARERALNLRILITNVVTHLRHHLINYTESTAFIKEEETDELKRHSIETSPLKKLSIFNINCWIERESYYNDIYLYTFNRLIRTDFPVHWSMH